MRLLVTLMLGLFLAGELCHGQRSSRRGRGMGRGRRRQFSCIECRENTMYDPYVCQNCYRGADGDEPFKCRRCKYVGSRSQPFVCQKCSKGPRFLKIFIKNNCSFQYLDDYSSSTSATTSTISPTTTALKI